MPTATQARRIASCWRWRMTSISSWTTARRRTRSTGPPSCAACRSPRSGQKLDPDSPGMPAQQPGPCPRAGQPPEVAVSQEFADIAGLPDSITGAERQHEQLLTCCGRRGHGCARSTPLCCSSSWRGRWQAWTSRPRWAGSGRVATAQRKCAAAASRDSNRTMPATGALVATLASLARDLTLSQA